MEQYPLPGALKSQRLAVKLAVVICEKVQKAKFWTAGDFMHSCFILLEQLVSFLPFLAKILNKWQEWQRLDLEVFLFKSKESYLGAMYLLVFWFVTLLLTWKNAEIQPMCMCSVAHPFWYLNRVRQLERGCSSDIRVTFWNSEECQYVILHVNLWSMK